MRGKTIDWSRAGLDESLVTMRVPRLSLALESQISFPFVPSITSLRVSYSNLFHVSTTTMTDSESFPLFYGETDLDEILRLSSNDFDLPLCDWVGGRDVNVLFPFLACTSLPV